jgi:hypothetical protein
MHHTRIVDIFHSPDPAHGEDMEEKTNESVPIPPEPEKKGSNRALVITAWIVGGFMTLCVILPICVIAVMRLLGPKIGNTFSTISSSLP